jgi:hypothetical protein
LSKGLVNVNKVPSDAGPLRLETEPCSEIARQDETSYHTEADTESLSPTDLESVFLDYLTISSITLIGILETSATWELIKLLLNYKILHPLYELAIRKAIVEKFERHLRGFLRAYRTI